MGTGKGTTSNTVQNQNVQYTPYGLPNFNDIYSRAQQVSNTPYNPYTGELVAGLNGYQFGGINQIMDASQQAQPYVGQGGNWVGEGAGDIAAAYGQAGAGAPWIQNYGLNNIGQGAGMIASAQSPLQQGQQQIQQGAGAIGAGQGYLPGAANAVNQGLGTIGQAPGYVGQGGNYLGQGIDVAGSGIGNIGTGLSAMQQGLGNTGNANNMFGWGADTLGNSYNTIQSGIGNIGTGVGAMQQGLGNTNNASNMFGLGSGAIGQGINTIQGGMGNIGAGLGAMQEGFHTAQVAPDFIQAGGYYGHSGAQGIGNIGAGDIAQYMNPYQQNVIQATMANMAEDNAQQQQQVQGNAAMRGALGGDRVGVAQSELARQQALANNQTLAGLNAQNYQQATQTALTQQQNQQANQARQMQAAGLFGSLGSQSGQLGATQAGIGQGIAGTANQYGQLGSMIGGLGQSLAGIGSQYGQLGATQAGIGQGIAGTASQYGQLGSQQAGIGQALAGIGSQYGQLGATQAGIGQGMAGTANQYGQLGATIGGLGQGYAGLGGLLSNIGQANFSGANTLGGLGATQAGIGSQLAGAGNALVGSAGQQAGIGNLYAGTGLQYGNLAGQNSALAAQQGALGGQLANLGPMYAGLGTMGQNAGIQGGTSLLGAGTVSQQNQQALDTANYQQYLQQLAFPYQQAQFAAGIGLPASGAMGGFQSQIGNANQVITPPGMSVPQGLIGGSALLGGLFGNGWGGTGAQGGRVESFARGGETPDIDYRAIDELAGKSWIPEIKDINIPTSFHANMSMAPMSAIPQASNQSALGSVAGLAGLAGAGKTIGSGLGSLFGSGATTGILGATGAEDAGLLAGAGIGAAADLGVAADIGAAAGVAGEASGLVAADLAPLLLLKRGGSVGYDEGGGISYPAEQIGGNNPYSLQNIRGGIPRMQGIQTPKPFMGEFMSIHPPMNIAKAAAATPAITPEQMAKLGEMGSRMMTVETEASGGRIPHYAAGGPLTAAELQARNFDPFNRFPYPPPVPQHFPEPMDFSRHLRDPIPGTSPGDSIAPIAPGTIPGMPETAPGAGGDAGGPTGDGVGTAGDIGNPGGPIVGGGLNAVEQAAQNAPNFNTSAPNVSVNPDNTPGKGVSVIGNPAPSISIDEGDTNSAHNNAMNDAISAALAAAINSQGLPSPSPNDMVSQAFDALGSPSPQASPAMNGPLGFFNDPSGFFGAPDSGNIAPGYGVPGTMGIPGSGNIMGGAPSPSPASQAMSQADLTGTDVQGAPGFYGGMFGNPTSSLADQLGLNDISASPAPQSSPSSALEGTTAGPMANTGFTGALGYDAGVIGDASAGLSGLGGMASGAFGGLGGMGMGATAGLNGGLGESGSAMGDADASAGAVGAMGGPSDAAGVADAAAASADASGMAGIGIGLGDAGVSGDASGAADASGGVGIGADAGGDGSGGDAGVKRGGYIRGYDDGGEVYGSDATMLDDGTILDSPYPKPSGSTKGDFLTSPNEAVARRWPDAALGDSAPLPQPRPAEADVGALPSNLEMQPGPYAAARRVVDIPDRPAPQPSWGEIMNTRSPMYASATPQRQTPLQMFTSPRGLAEFGARVLAANPAHGWGAAIGQGALGTLGSFDKMSNEDLSARQKAQALAAKIKEHVDGYTQETAHQKRTSDLAEKRINQENMRPLGMTANNQPLLWDSKTGRIINGFTGQPPTAEDKMSSLGTRSGGANPQMMRFQLAQQAYPDDPKKAAEVALGIRPPTDLQLDSYLVKNFPQLIGKSPQEIAAFREQFKLQSFPGAASGAKPMPTDKSQLEKDQVYQTPRGTARWDGEKFNPL